MGEFIFFTDEQKRRANEVDLERFLRSRGEKLLPSGRDKRLSSDKSITVRGNGWYDHAAERGGYPIDFMKEFYGMSFQEAVTTLLGGETGVPHPRAEKNTEPEPKPFALPPRNGNMRRVFAYLVGTRNIDRDVVTHFARAETLYEDAEYHNAVFVGQDEHGIAMHAHKRSTNSMGDAFRINVEGSLPQYSFHHVGESEILHVFEAPIDMLSFISLYPSDWRSHSYVSLCGTGSQAMLWMLEQNPQLKRVALCLDNDKAGIAATERLGDLLREKSYDTTVILPCEKDWNDVLTTERNRTITMEMR